MTDELKPCPFCGGSNLEVVDTPQGYFIDCSCGCFTGDFETREAAIDAWNTRAERTCANMSSTPGQFTCSECHDTWVKPAVDIFNYCPSCGAKVVD